MLSMGGVVFIFVVIPLLFGLFVGLWAWSAQSKNKSGYVSQQPVSYPPQYPYQQQPVYYQGRQQSWVGPAAVGFIAGAAVERHHLHHQAEQQAHAAQFQADMDRIIHPQPVHHQPVVEQHRYDYAAHCDPDLVPQSWQNNHHGQWDAGGYGVHHHGW